MQVMVKKENQRNSPYRIFFVDYLNFTFDDTKNFVGHNNYPKNMCKLYSKPKKHISYYDDEIPKECNVGLVYYIPTNKENNYTKSCNIFCYTYKYDNILLAPSKSVFRLLHDFIVTNNISNIQLSKNDVEAYKSANLNILDAFSDIDNLKIYIKDYTK